MNEEQLNFLTFGDRAIAEMYVILGGDLSKLSTTKVTRKNDEGNLEEVVFQENDYNIKKERVGKVVLDLTNKSGLHAQNLAKAEIFAKTFDLQMKR